MWMRNLVFVVTVMIGAGTLGWMLFPAAVPPPGKGFDPNTIHDPEFVGVVGEIDALFAQTWEKGGVKPAPGAPELAVVRRMSLALTGSVPSVQEIPAATASPPGSATSWRRTAPTTRSSAS